MPLYEYACPDCKQDCELLIRGDEKPVCPACGGRKLMKLLSVPAGHVDGSKGGEFCEPTGGPCGLPQCGMGGCGM